ncbi:hypothetical protein CsatA_003083 [Cannabis sativa]
MKSIILVMMMTTMVVGCLGRMDVAIFMNPTPNRCYTPGEYCAHIEIKDCCEGLHCEGSLFSGTCVPYAHCLPIGEVCLAGISQCCYPNHCKSKFMSINGHCTAPDTLPDSE